MRKVVIAAVGALALSGCSSVPVAQHFPASGQQMVMSASHWQVIANASADRLVGHLGEGRAVTLAPPAAGSAFEHAFGGMLATALTERNISVSHGTAKADQASLSYGVQLVRHGHAPVQHPAKLAFLGAMAGGAVWAVDAGWPAASAAPFIGAGLGALSPGASGLMPDAPDTEIVVTTALSRGGADVARTTGVFYVQGADAHGYVPPTPVIEIPVV